MNCHAILSKALPISKTQIGGQVCWVDPKSAPIAAFEEGKILWSGKQSKLAQPTVVVPSVQFDKTVSLNFDSTTSFRDHVPFQKLNVSHQTHRNLKNSLKQNCTQGLYLSRLMSMISSRLLFTSSWPSKVEHKNLQECQLHSFGLQWPELAPRIPPAETAVQAEQPRFAAAVDLHRMQSNGLTGAGSDAEAMDGAIAGGMPRANGMAIPAAKRAESVAAAVPQELAELLDVGEACSLISGIRIQGTKSEAQKLICRSKSSPLCSPASPLLLHQGGENCISAPENLVLRSRPFTFSTARQGFLRSYILLKILCSQGGA